MNALQAVKNMVASTGKSERAISQAIGRNPNFIASTTTNGTTNLKTETLFSIAKACGFTLLIRNDENGTEYVIDE